MNIINLGKIVVYGGTAQINLDLVPSSIATKSKTRFEQNKKKGKNNSIREKEISEVYISFSFTELLLFSVQFVDYIIHLNAVLSVILVDYAKSWELQWILLIDSLTNN